MKEKNKCTHSNQTTVVLNASCGVEEIADKCQDCGKLLNQRIEI